MPVCGAQAFAVGAPLLWGVAQTVHKAFALFG
jgi:hypothetical protein